jgi:hypothetical protein
MLATSVKLKIQHRELLLSMLADIHTKVSSMCSEANEVFRNPISKHYDKHLSMRRDSYGSS